MAGSVPGSHNRLADRWLKEWLPIVISTEIDIAADLVGDTGIKLVTSSV
jgi:hypothetical protein